MNNRDKIFEQIFQQLKDYRQKPDKQLWKDIEKHLNKPKHFPVKVLTTTGIVLIAIFITMLAIVPNKEVPNKDFAVNNEPIILNNNIADNPIPKIANNNTEIYQVGSSNQETEQTEKNEISANEFIENKIEQNNTYNQEVKTQNPLNNDLQQESEQEKQSDITIVDNDIFSEKTTETEQQENEIYDDRLILINAFQPESPNEKINVFKPIYRQVSDYQMQIFTRTGQRIFQSNDINTGWDGRINGKSADAGVYIYIVKYKDTDGKEKKEENKFMLIR